MKGKTVEEAIERALRELHVPREKVDVEILENASRRLLGLRKGLAKVKVTRIDEQVEEQKETDFEAPIDAVLEEGLQGTGDVEETVQTTGVRIQDGRLVCSFNSEVNPTILPTDDVVLTVNGKVQKESVVIQPDDQLKLSVSNELIPPQFTIQCIDNQMIALLTLTPGKKVEKTLIDTDFTLNLVPKVSEEVFYYNDLKPQQIVDELRKMGVKQGIIFPAIQKVIDVNKPYELIVARGISPEEGTDGNLDIHIEFDSFNLDSLERVEFREMNRISTVKEEAVIATHVLPVEGTDGRNLFGKVIPTKRVQDIVLRLGKNVTLEGQEVIAKISGNPVIDWHNQVIKIDVNPEYYHPGEVGLESGNIRLEGDVRIGGNVLPSMFVGASGSVQVGGAVTKATVEAVRVAVVYGNVLSSTIMVGKQEVTSQKLVAQLKDIMTGVHQIRHEMEQVLAIRGSTEDELTPVAFKRLIHLLLEKKHMNLKQLTIDFIQAVKESDSELEEGWQEVASHLHALFVARINEEETVGFQQLIERATGLIEADALDVSSKGQLIVPYAVNSHLYSSGDIRVSGKGVFQSVLIAKNDVTIEGVCRGGEIVAENLITLKETGSKNPVTTIVKTSATGRINIEKAYVGTEIQVGNRKYAFMRDEYDVHARLDEEGQLIWR